ncbi:unnamed protein product [Effrenium voratum]|uniref:EF-hand domain-containing protein n=1 Tax=Effrenium voratum TaxID=2562239 RepID=A0AA36MMS9_9DINO|nr:unnamed protein product [Effrenium voratum]
MPPAFLQVGNLQDECLGIAGMMRMMPLACLQALFTEEKVKQMAQQADADCDGYIHYAEFIAWILDCDPMMSSRVLAASTFVAEEMPDGILPESPLKLAEKHRKPGNAFFH